MLVLFEDFCDVYIDILGAGYGGGSKTTMESFHTKSLPRLLDRLAEWALARGHSDLHERVRRAEEAYTAAMRAITW